MNVLMECQLLIVMRIHVPHQSAHLPRMQRVLQVIVEAVRLTGMMTLETGY